MSYGVILADPPWSYRNGGVEGSAARHYATASTADLARLDVAGLAADDAVLVMWATWPCLVDAFQLIDAWGFKYVTGMPWIKCQDAPFVDLFGEHVLPRPSWGIGFWVRGCTEPILICRRGKPKIPESSQLGLISERFEHSRKPDNIYHYCEAMRGPYLEMFARRPRPGWDAFGNEIEGSIEIANTPRNP